MYKTDDTDLNKLLPIQRKRKTYVTVREAARAWGVSVGTAHNKLLLYAEIGLVEKVGGHFHIKESK